MSRRKNLRGSVRGRLVPTEAALAKQEQRDYEPASVLLDRILGERRRLWEEAELARLTKAGKPPKDDKWKAKYEQPAAPDPSKLPPLPEGWCWATVEQLTDPLIFGLRREHDPVTWTDCSVPNYPAQDRKQISD